MKILHTADWHIGKKLHKHDLARDFDLFIKWLGNTIEKEKVDVLLVSGDIFDLANPSSDARRQYYRALMELRKFNCKIILTGGNHDSPAMLNAPAEILRELDMHVIGGLPEDLEEVIIPVKNEQGETEVVIAALPYLRDSDLRSAGDGHTYEDRLEALRKGIQLTFSRAAEICEQQFPGVPAIAMGHLFAAGAETSESERDIQIGNQAAFNALQFGDYFEYIALGHIHKPQKVNAAVPTYYSGSPLPLSFSERRDEKRVLLLDTAALGEPQSIPVPVFRSLLKISGSLEELQQKLREPGSVKELDTLIEVEMQEEDYDANKIFLLDELVTGFQQPGFEIVKHRASFRNKISGAGEIYNNRQLEDLKPREVFTELIERHAYDENTHREILGAFDELLEELQQKENAG
ncbi:exonuclease subunit SbcD [Antarcticibacterium flavum]|uniref:Nuclease SbcCD subunit D n=1 Tax=Antarcticibacterium flavum TaxID=2058175 RepID=A0A5B7X7T8_9FLAO|nr:MULTISPECIES: exonuclease SbcCD subunit D C-terminal domain-containing protein [Antarcticibacterium]MCM4160694.1 exonuclease sbcCD subunit D [Antarcticibacterium sp. W02-3]QCY71160.1 exonuclease subunit SbcD [Antarcticibacterium flavum]